LVRVLYDMQRQRERERGVLAECCWVDRWREREREVETGRVLRLPRDGGGRRHISALAVRH